MSLFTSRLIVASIHGTEYFVLVIFDGINLSSASTKPVLKLTHMSLTDVTVVFRKVRVLKLGHVVLKACTFIEIDLA